MIRTLAEDDKVRISFADTGCGIPKDAMDKIRDPFFTTKEVGKGTGLGLSIVDQIVTSHGGELIIESEPGKGTTVTIVLAIVATASLDEEAQDDEAQDGAANDPDIGDDTAGDEPGDEENSDTPEVATV